MQITQLNINRETIPIGAGWEPDPAWVFTDADGTEHRWRKGKDGWEIPTLKQETYEVDPGSVCPCCQHETEPLTESRWVVPETGEVISPGYRRTGERHVAGTMSWDGEWQSSTCHGMKKVYNLSNCEIPFSPHELSGKFRVTSLRRELDGFLWVWRGEFVGTGEITESVPTGGL